MTTSLTPTIGSSHLPEPQTCSLKLRGRPRKLDTFPYRAPLTITGLRNPKNKREILPDLHIPDSFSGTSNDGEKILCLSENRTICWRVDAKEESFLFTHDLTERKRTLDRKIEKLRREFLTFEEPPTPPVQAPLADPLALRAPAPSARAYPTSLREDPISTLRKHLFRPPTGFLESFPAFSSSFLFLQQQLRMVQERALLDVPKIEKHSASSPSPAPLVVSAPPLRADASFAPLPKVPSEDPLKTNVSFPWSQPLPEIKPLLPPPKSLWAETQRLRMALEKASLDVPKAEEHSASSPSPAPLSRVATPPASHDVAKDETPPSRSYSPDYAYERRRRQERQERESAAWGQAHTNFKADQTLMVREAPLIESRVFCRGHEINKLENSLMREDTPAVREQIRRLREEQSRDLSSAAQIRADARESEREYRAWSDYADKREIEDR